MFSDEDIKSMGSINPAERISLRPENGNDGERWSEIVNMRLEWDADYPTWKMRGGSEIRLELPEGITILNFQGFTVRVNGPTVRYIAVHCSDGKIYLWDVDQGNISSAWEVILEGFGTDSLRVEMFVFGRNLYVFDLDTDVYKIYNFSNQTSSNFGSHEYSLINSWRYDTTLTMGEEYDQKNIFGFKKGERAAIAASEYNLSSNVIGTSNWSPSIGWRIYEYIYNGGVFLTINGTDYKENALIVVSPDTSVDSTNLSGALANDSSDPELFIGILPVDINTQEPVLDMFEATLESYFSETASPSLDNFGYNLSADTIGETQGDVYGLVGSVSDGSGGFVKQNIIMPITSDLEAIANRHIKFEFNKDQTRIINNNDFPELDNYKIYRSYIIFNELADGSIVAAGRPVLVEVDCKDIFQHHAIIQGVVLSVKPVADSNIINRYLCSTRWQSNIPATFIPSSPKYPNSPYFIIRDISLNKQDITDRTPDNELIRSITEFIEMNGGVSTIIPPDKLTVNSIKQNAGTLLIGGYEIERPTPLVYGPDIIAHLHDLDFKILRVSNAIKSAEFTGFSATKSYGISKFEWDVSLSNVHIKIVDNNNNLVSEYNTAPNSTSGVVTFVCSEVNTSGIEVTLNIDMSVLGSVLNGQPDLFFDSNSYIIEFSEVSNPSKEGNIRISDSGVPLQDQYTGFYFEYFDGSVSSLVDTYFDGAKIPVFDGPGKISIHSLNTIVSAVHVVWIDESGATPVYHRIARHSIDEAESHGMPIDTPDSNNGLTTITIPDTTEINTVSQLSDFFTISTFPQQLSIERQFPIQDQKQIREFAIYGFDQDKTQLRTRLAVFTEENIQTGYIMQDNNAPGGFSAQFEVQENLDTLINEESVSTLNNQLVVYQNQNGVQYVGSSRGWLIDSRRYPELINDPIVDVIYNRENKEYWYINNTNEIFTVTNEGRVKKVVYGEPVTTGGFFHGMFLVSAGNGLMETDIDGLDGDDFAVSGTTPIEISIISQPLTQHLYQMRLLEATVIGDGGGIGLDVDLQKARYEKNGTTWSKHFNSDISFNMIGVEISGTNFEIYRRGIRPRIKLSGLCKTIQDVYINVVQTENKGLAR